ncbi:MAG: transposase [Planctomycetota bacterium]
MTKRKPKPKKREGGGRGRFSAARKAEAVRRLVAGEDLDTLARELGVTAATLAEWREKFLQAGQAALKTRKQDDRDEEILRLKAMVGELTMRNEILQEGIRIKEGRPFLTRRPRP